MSTTTPIYTTKIPPTPPFIPPMVLHHPYLYHQWSPTNPIYTTKCPNHPYFYHQGSPTTPIYTTRVPHHPYLYHQGSPTTMVRVSCKILQENVAGSCKNRARSCDITSLCPIHIIYIAPITADPCFITGASGGANNMWGGDTNEKDP